MESTDRREPAPHERMYQAIMQAEQCLRESYEQDIGAELGIADNAAALLALVMSAVGQKAGTVAVDEQGVPVSGDTDLLNLFALQLIGARALRVMRAARATLACGYEAESRAHDRILFELLEHRRALLADDTGTEAKAWIDGERGRGIGKRVAQQSPEDLYANLSQDSHGDPGPLLRLIDAESTTMLLGPRRTNVTRASLLMHAGLARDQAAVIARLADIELRGLPGLDAAIDAAMEKLAKETAGS